MERLLSFLHASLTQPATWVFLVAFIGSFFVYHIRNRRRMLAAKAADDSLFALYYLMMGAHSGAFGGMIAVMGGLVQVATPDHLMRRTLIYRNIVAVFLALVGVFLVAERATDLLPLIAVGIARFIELQSSAQRIRIGMLSTMFLWLWYSLDNELYLMVLAQLTVGASMALAIWRVRRENIMRDQLTSDNAA